MQKYFGYHLMLDCSGCNDNIKDYDTIHVWIKDLVNEIDMIAADEPVIKHLLPGDPKQGYSVMQLITTSNICAHFMDFDGTAYLDIFSCKEFDIAKAKEHFCKYFAPKKIRVNYITRHADKD